jgi:biotin operon repressor
VKLPQILSLSIDNINKKIEFLQELGFKNPVSLIEKLPQILGYSTESIKNKLNLLQELGFNNPVGLIEKFPAILGYSGNNIATKVRLLRRVIKLYNLPYTPQEIIEYIPGILSINVDKILVLIRVFREFAQDINEVSKSNITLLLFSNLENLLLAVDSFEDKTKVGIKEIIKTAKEFKSQNLPKEEKRRLIDNGLTNHPKIKRIYFHGYPLEKQKTDLSKTSE